jgi:hypothetical protein
VLESQSSGEQILKTPPEQLAATQQTSLLIYYDNSLTLADICQEPALQVLATQPGLCLFWLERAAAEFKLAAEARYPTV